MTPFRRVFLWLAPLLLATGLGVLLGPRQLDLLESDLPRYSFGDTATNGTSTAWTRDGRPWVFGMSLRPGFAFPYAAAGIHLSNGGAPLDLRGYDSLVVEWHSRKQQTLRLQVQLAEPGTTDTTNSLSFVPMEGALPIGPIWSRQAIALRDLSIPLWWDNLNGTAPRPHPGILRHGSRLFLQNGMGTSVGIDDTIEVRALSLRGGSWMPLLLLIGCAIAFSTLVQLSLRRALGPNRASGMAKTPKPSDVVLESRRDEETRRVLEWVGAHYMDPDIAVESAGRGAGVHPRRIPSLLKDSGHASFPALVNSLRMDQAKRLLRETDRSAGEIGTAVGMPNTPHFHRVFKKVTGMTPLEWRAAQQVSDGS